MNQPLQEKARECVRKVLDKHNGEFSYEALCEMDYIENCVNGEWMRMKMYTHRKILLMNIKQSKVSLSKVHFCNYCQTIFLTSVEFTCNLIFWPFFHPTQSQCANIRRCPTWHASAREIIASRAQASSSKRVKWSSFPPTQSRTIRKSTPTRRSSIRIVLRRRWSRSVHLTPFCPSVKVPAIASACGSEWCSRSLALHFSFTTSSLSSARARSIQSSTTTELSSSRPRTGCTWRSRRCRRPSAHCRHLLRNDSSKKRENKANWNFPSYWHLIVY